MIDIVEILDRETAKKIKVWPRSANRASEAAHPCIRYLVAVRLNPEKIALHDVSLQRIFEEGNLHEQALLREIQDAGFQVVEQQRPFRWEKFQITGHIDAKIALNGRLIPLELKSCSPNIFQHIKNLEPGELINSKYSWIRRYPGQLLLYVLMDGSEEGIIIFKNKSTGEKCQKNFRLTDENLNYVESILKKLEKVNEYVERKELPPVEMSEECKRCAFQKTLCFPDQDYGLGFDFLNDEEIEAKLIRWSELQKSAKEFQQLDKELKAHFKGKNAIVGDFKIESKQFERKSYVIPDEVKKQYEQRAAYWRVVIERL